MCVGGSACGMYIYFSNELVTPSPTVTISKSGAQILAFQYCSLLMEKWLFPELDHGQRKMNLEHLMSANKEVLRVLGIFQEKPA